MQLLNGKELADKIKDDLKSVVTEMKSNGQTVSLAVIQVGNDSASSVYVRNKEKACEYIGIDSIVYHLKEDISQETIIDCIETLNEDKTVNGILRSYR